MAVSNSELFSFGIAQKKDIKDYVADAVSTAESTPAAGSVGTAALASGAVTAAKIASLSSAQLATICSDETGSGALCFATSPTLVTPVLGTVTSGNISACTSTSMVMVTPVLGTPTSGVLDNCTGAPHFTNAVLVTPAIGTPSAGVLTNCTGLPDASKLNPVPSSYAANGAIAITDRIALITKNSAAANMTLAAGAAGASTKITSTTSFAHTIAATGIIMDGTTGGAKTTITLAAFPGASIELVSDGTNWYVIAQNHVTSIV
jgi:hypothetical protein